MQKRTLKVALLAALTVILVFAFAGVALAAPPWSDLPDTITAKYGITDNQVASISDGYPGGLWKPFQNITRAQFTKMAVAAFNVDLVNAATPSFTDVPKTNYYYPWIEGAKAVGMVNGSGGQFKPNDNITREQAIAIVVRFVAQANGYNLATMYTAADISALLGQFGDGSSVGSALKTEMAFAIDFGITQGNDFGNLVPQGLLTRIQAAAFLIRAKTMVPPAPVVPTAISIVSQDKAENLIGQSHAITFKVTQAGGAPAPGVLVDFDTLFSVPFYVGNISPQAAMTDANGEVTVNVISAEPGTQRVSASVAGLAAIYTTKYWLVLDEVYTTGVTSAQNNVGTPHEWGARVVVFGPGPRSTSQQDWYNAIYTKVAFDPTNINYYDGIDATDDHGYPWADFGDGWSFADELVLNLHDYAPRTMAGIDVKWSIYDIPDNPLTAINDSVTSVGNITAVDGVAITPAKTATGHTDANGFSKIKIESTVTGVTLTQAIATYAGNPYPEQLFDHETFDPDSADHFDDWYGQPAEFAEQTKTWIAHTLPPQGGPITPAYSAANIGEEKTLTLTLVDIYGNPIAGREVEWYMQGVGFFQTDDSADTSDPNHAAGNHDFDVTNKDGVATLFVKSYKAGEQIIHAKVRDKGTGGAEGTFQTYTAEVQWFDVNVATFDDPTTHTELHVWDPNANSGHGGYVTVTNNEALSSNPVGGSHTFDMWVYGLKLEYAPTLANPDGQTPWIDADVTGSAYDGVIDARDAAYFGGILLVNDVPKGAATVNGTYAHDANGNGIIDPSEAGTATVVVAGRTLTLSLVGGITEYDWDQDGYKEPFTGQTGIYLPLEGKTVTFSKSNVPGPPAGTANGKSNLGAMFDGASVTGVGSFNPTSDVTDENGMVSVTVSSDVKGPETIAGVVDWAGNPHNHSELLTAYAKKAWQAGVLAASDLDISVWINDQPNNPTTGVAQGTPVKVADDTGEIADVSLPAWGSGANPLLNSAHVTVHVRDAFGNDLPDYEVVYLLEDINSVLNAGGQAADDTLLPFAYLVDRDTVNDLGTPALPYDQNGTRPDADEPTPASDPYAVIVGPGGTHSFFFNQWLGPNSGVGDQTTPAGQPGLPEWPLGRVSEYFTGYSMTIAQYAAFWQTSTVWGFDGVVNGVTSTVTNVGLATDGAKAWTLDGFFDPTSERFPAGVQPNLLTGSNIDIQLADELGGVGTPTPEPEVKSILRVMIYSPANGVVEEGTPIYSQQVHVTWAKPVATTVTLTPATDITVAGLENQTVTVNVKDQFGQNMAGVVPTLTVTTLEGSGVLAVPGALAATDVNGNTTATWAQAAGSWGVQEVQASVGTVNSSKSTIQWVYRNGLGALGTPLSAVAGQTKIDVIAAFTPWNGFSLTAYMNPAQAAIGGPTPYTGVAMSITTSHTFVSAERYYVTAAASTNTDGFPNWISGLVP